MNETIIPLCKFTDGKDVFFSKLSPIFILRLRSSMYEFYVLVKVFGIYGVLWLPNKCGKISWGTIQVTLEEKIYQ